MTATMMLRSFVSRRLRVGASLKCASRAFFDVPSTYLGRVRDKSKHTLDQSEPVYKLGKHRSNALELIQKQPIIEVEEERATCDGGGGPLGHPLEYISLERPGEVKSCIYCGLRYKQKAGGHH